MCLAVPGKIIDIIGDDPLTRQGTLDFGGAVKKVSLAYVPEATVGNYAIVHAGFAISLVDEGEALETIKFVEEMDNNEIS